jgi:hypothetical protein
MAPGRFLLWVRVDGTCQRESRAWDHGVVDTQECAAASRAPLVRDSTRWLPPFSPRPEGAVGVQVVRRLRRVMNKVVSSAGAVQHDSRVGFHSIKARTASGNLPSRYQLPVATRWQGPHRTAIPPTTATPPSDGDVMRIAHHCLTLRSGGNAVPRGRSASFVWRPSPSPGQAARSR